MAERMVDVLFGISFKTLSDKSWAIGLRLQVKSVGFRMTTADSIYTDRSIHTLPHRWRVRQIVRLLQELCPNVPSYADVGCGDGFVTAQIVRELQPKNCIAYDFNPEVLELGKQRFPEIAFCRWNFTADPPPAEKYSLVTCLETVEHVSEMRNAIKSLLSITEHYLLITVPIEIGPLGVAKFTAKAVLRRETFTSENQGSKFDYFRRLLSGAPISQFRKTPENGHWKLHTGFDYRELDALLRSESVSFQASNHGWNRFYVMRLA
jgi:2-polyprenyl-3-methyl-5-hydroxy-6-metoxy-1,4-benzoquinol methylase